MSDIFISYARKDRPIAMNLANALESENWTVWWDRRLRGGDYFDDVIQTQLDEARCVIVLWSESSVQSQYVKAEAARAQKHNKLIPVSIDNVTPPLRFELIHTVSLLGWDGSKDFSEFRTLVQDIAAIVGPPATEHQQVQPADRQPSIAESSPKKKRESKPGTVIREKLKDGSEGPEMVVVPAGTFKMGDIQGNGGDSEVPVHTVSIAKPFAIGRYPITFEDYDRFASATSRPSPDHEGWGRGRQPAINVSWDDAVEYAKWLSEQTGKRYRLPTEAEWEYVARAGTETGYWWGNEMKPDMANCSGGGSRWGGKQTSPVGSFPPNPFGLYDTAGNVWEWAEDWWHENYYGAPTDGSAWLEPNGGKYGRRVMRGGSWGDVPESLRASYRGGSGADYRGSNVGFRLAQDIDDRNTYASEDEIADYFRDSISDVLADRKREREGKKFSLVQADRNVVEYSRQEIDNLTAIQRERLFAADPEMAPWWRGKPLRDEWVFFRLKGGVWITREQIDQITEEHYATISRVIPALPEWYLRDRKP